MQWLFQAQDPSINKFNFYDLTGKMNFKLNSTNRIFFSFYAGSDNFFSGNNGINWSNRAGTFRWNKILTNKLFLNTTLSTSGYDYNLYTDVSKDERWNSHISNVNLKSDFSFFLKPQNEITFGVGLNGYKFNPGNLQSGSANQKTSNTSVRNSLEFVLYGNQEIKVNKHWGLNYGMRFSTWTNTGEAFEYIFDDSGNPVDTLNYQSGKSYITFANLEPRVTVQYLFNEHAALKASYMRNVQNLHLISNSISPFTSLDVWLPSSYNIKPQRADQLTLGYHDLHAQTGISWVLETFYKKMYNQIDYANHAELLLNPLLENQLRFGEGHAYGFEFQAKRAGSPARNGGLLLCTG
ncbi:MAG: TonB-dependent receptor [Flammeovirgaceae bacterium]|nr:TonB-dependent receptor [Flammeovirgaceae bacterium]